jgi:hypothetical protein
VTLVPLSIIAREVNVDLPFANSDDVALASTIVSPSFVVMMPPKMPASTMPTTEPPPPTMSTPVASVASEIDESAGDGAAGAPSSDGGDETRAEPAATTVQDAGHVAASQPRSGEGNAASEQDRGPGQADAGMVKGAALEHAVTEIMSMGFSEADTRRALRMVRRMLHILVLAAVFVAPRSRAMRTRTPAVLVWRQAAQLGAFIHQVLP